MKTRHILRQFLSSSPSFTTIISLPTNTDQTLNKTPKLNKPSLQPSKIAKKPLQMHESRLNLEQSPTPRPSKQQQNHDLKEGNEQRAKPWGVTIKKPQYRNVFKPEQQRKSRPWSKPQQQPKFSPTAKIYSNYRTTTQTWTHSRSFNHSFTNSS